MEQEVKNIKLSLPYVDETGKATLREQTVSFKKVVEKDVDMGRWNGMKGSLVYYTMGLSIVIPDHIYTTLNGRYVSRSTDRREYADYGKDFKKTVTSDSLEALTKRYREIILDYKWLIDMDKMILLKVIFYSFDGDVNETKKSEWNGIKCGKELEINYGYIVGYVSEDGKTRLNEDKKFFHHKYDSFVNKWGYVEHTEMREEFFAKIFSRFKGIIQELKNFEKSLSNKSIDNIIASHPKLLSV